MQSAADEIIMFSSKLQSSLEFILLFPYAVYAYGYLIYRKLYPPLPKPLDNETILITGSSQGIGREMVFYLAKNHPGSKLVLWDINEAGNKDTTQKAKQYGAVAFEYTVDVSDRLQVEACARKVKCEVGDVTILINNAGVCTFGTLLDLPPEKIEKIISVNLTSHFWTIRAFLPSMIEKNYGHIVTTCSMAASRGIRFLAPYAASKYGVRGYLESLKDELRIHPLKPDNIKFTTVFPWFINTPMISGFKLEMKFDWIAKFQRPTDVARQIIEGMRCNEENVFCPGVMELFSFCLRLLPRKLSDMIMDWALVSSTYESDTGKSHRLY